VRFFRRAIQYVVEVENGSPGEMLVARRVTRSDHQDTRAGRGRPRRVIPTGLTSGRRLMLARCVNSSRGQPLLFAVAVQKVGNLHSGPCDESTGVWRAGQSTCDNREPLTTSRTLPNRNCPAVCPGDSLRRHLRRAFLAPDSAFRNLRTVHELLSYIGVGSKLPRRARLPIGSATERFVERRPARMSCWRTQGSRAA